MTSEYYSNRQLQLIARFILYLNCLHRRLFPPRSTGGGEDFMGDATELMGRFGRLVAAHRKRMHMTQVQLSDACGISADMIVRIEGGGTGVRFPNIQRLADALGVDPAELFTSDVPHGKLARPNLNRLTARLAALSDADLQLVSELVDVALKSRR